MATVAHGLGLQAEQQDEINRLKSLGKQHPMIQMDFESILERGNHDQQKNAQSMLQIIEAIDAG